MRFGRCKLNEKRRTCIHAYIYILNALANLAYNCSVIKSICKEQYDACFVFESHYDV